MHSQVIHGVLALPRISTAHLGQLRHLIPLGFAVQPVAGVPAGAARVHRVGVGGGAVLPGGSRHPGPVPDHVAGRGPGRGDRGARPGGRRGDRPAAGARGRRSAAGGGAVPAQREAVGAGGGDPAGQPRDPGPGRLRHAVGAGAAGGGAGAVPEPEGGRGGDAAERVPAEDQRVAAGGGLDDRRAVPGLRPGAVAGGGGGVPVGADGGLPAGGGAAGAGAPGG